LATDKKQADKFREAARELETDDSEENFDRALKKVAGTKPTTKPEGPKKET
jgi:hypothetical protein